MRCCTSFNSLVGELLREGDRKIKEKFEALLQGQVIQTTIDEQIVYNQLDNDESAIWSLLLASGYLKVLSYDREELLEYGEEAKYTLTLTNDEVERMFYQNKRRIPLPLQVGDECEKNLTKEHMFW